MKTYICKETFQINKYDDDGFWTDETTTIHFGALFQTVEPNPKIIGGEGTVHLEGVTVDEGTWLEITEDTLAEYFDEVKQAALGGGGNDRMDAHHNV